MFEIFLLLKECSAEIQTYIFQMKTPFSTTNYLVENFSENVDVSVPKS